MKQGLHPSVLWYLVILLLLSGCNDDEISAIEKGSLKITFDNRAGDHDLEFNKDYINSSGETFQVTKLNYYISNIKLRSTSEKEFIVPQDSSYFLIFEDQPASQTITINNIPVGDYNEITFTIGVDSLRSTMDISKRTGALDPAQTHDGMYWTWNSGYIFFKMEGTSPAAPADQQNKYYYHIGGFGGYDSHTLNNIRETTISMGDAQAEVRSEGSPQIIHLQADILELFKAPNQFSIADHSLVMFSEFSKNISENYVDMFRYSHVSN